MLQWNFSINKNVEPELDPSKYTPSGKLIGPRQRKVVVLGARGVGKSSLVTRYNDGDFPVDYYPTIEESYEKPMSYKGRDFNLNILDTAGHDEFTILRPKQACGVNGFIIQYSIDNPQSFYIAKKVKDKITNFIGPDTFPMVLVGNKSDLPRRVPAEEAKKLAEELKCPYIETSAKDNQNIYRVFESILVEIENALNPENPKSGNCFIM